MLIRLRMWLLASILLVLVVFGADWAIARARLDSVAIEVALDPPTVVANGKDRVTLVVRVTEEGKPRVGDLIQSWLDVGSGLLTPTFTYTDEDGMATIVFTPNAMTPYEAQDRAEIHLRDISIGYLIEVGKDTVATVPLVPASEPIEQKPRMTFGE
jgi:hypothetical protein